MNTNYQNQLPPPPPPPAQYVYVQRPGNGMAVAGLVLSLVALFFGLIPLTFFLAWILALLGFIFALLGRGKRYGGFRKTMATISAVIAVVAFGLGIYGLTVVIDVAEEFNDDLESINDCWEAIDYDINHGTDTADEVCE